MKENNFHRFCYKFQIIIMTFQITLALVWQEERKIAQDIMITNCIRKSSMKKDSKYIELLLEKDTSPKYVFQRSSRISESKKLNTKDNICPSKQCQHFSFNQFWILPAKLSCFLNSFTKNAKSLFIEIFFVYNFRIQ